MLLQPCNVRQSCIYPQVTQHFYLLPYKTIILLFHKFRVKLSLQVIQFLKPVKKSRRRLSKVAELLTNVHFGKDDWATYHAKLWSARVLTKLSIALMPLFHENAQSVFMINHLQYYQNCNTTSESCQLLQWINHCLLQQNRFNVLSQILVKKTFLWCWVGCILR